MNAEPCLSRFILPSTRDPVGDAADLIQCRRNTSSKKKVIGRDMGWRYPQPDHEHEFELVCLRLYRKLWKNESLQLYAKRGEKQYGVDIHDPLSLKPVRAVQCKFHEAVKTISPAAIREEVAKAETFPSPIDRYVIATTAKKAGEAQDTIADLNQRPDKKFTVEIHFWEEVCQYASELGAVTAELIIYGERKLAGAGQMLEISIMGIAGSWPKTDSGSAAGPFADIEKLLNERHLELARHELAKLPTGNDFEALPREGRYQLLRLRAKLTMEDGAFDEAAQLFLEAYAVSPELDQAKQNEVLALNLQNDADKAYARAARYVADGLTTPVMVLRLIDSVTAREQLEAHAAVIEPHLATDESVNVAMFFKYLALGDHELAQQAAARAVKLAPDSPHAQFAMGMAIHNASIRGDVSQRIAGLREAIRHYDLSEKAARARHFNLLLHEILANRAAAKGLIGDAMGAESDYKAVVSAAPQPFAYAARAVNYFLHEGNYDSAWELLEYLDRRTNEGKYLALVTEHRNASDSEKRSYIDEMESLSQEAWDRAVECRFYAVQWALELKDYERATSLVTEAFEREHPFQAHVLRGWISLQEGNLERAKEEASQALAQSIDRAQMEELRLLARMFVRLKDDANAVVLLEQVTTPGVFDDDMKALLMCAQRLERHDLLLRVCRDLRAAGVRDRGLQQLEVQLLSRYAPEEALPLAEEFARTSETPRYFAAFRNMLAVRLNKPDMVSLDASMLPTPAELPPEEANLVLLPWVDAGKYGDALAFLYAQRRMHFENRHAHGRYIAFFLRHSHQTRLVEAPSAIEAGCAALLALERNELQWVTIEDDQPIASRGEFASKSAIAKAIIGNKVGDTIEMPDKLVRPQTATVREIQSKYVRGFQDSLENFARRFPGASILQPFDVGDADNPDLTAVVESLKGRREHVDKCLQLYRDQPVPLFLLADCVGVSELEAVKALAGHPKGVVKCSEASPEFFALAVHAGIAPGAIVLSMSAIITLTLVDGWQYLDANREFLVSQRTSELIDEWVQEGAEDKPYEGGVLGLNEAGELIFMPLTSEDRRAKVEELDRMRRKIDERCEKASSVAMAALEPGTRNTYEKVLGLHNLESICVARDRDAILWTDDAILGTVAKADFGFKVIWTQLALRCFVDSGRLTLEDFELVTAKLAAGNYGSIIWHAGTIIAAGSAVGWDTNSWPFWQCLRLVENAPLHISGRTQIVVETLRLLRRSDCTELRQSAVVQSLLNALADPRAVRWILHNLDRIFMIDFLSARFLSSELERWLRFR